MAASRTDFIPLAVFPGIVKPRREHLTDRREIAERWSGAACLLNGQLAQVVGRLNDFATVRTLGGGVSHEWTWDAVNRIMTDGGGKFYS